MSEMVQRVSRAIWASKPRHHSLRDYDQNATDLEKWEVDRAARAAIEAMREPTQLMIFEGNGHGTCEDGDCFEVWQAMIDEALK